jgi:lipopolysaccharide/colanic/teichoic acid biosynthesis glycosyltransferase
MLKRLFDILASAAGIMALSPFFIVAAILIKIGSKGPVFYRGVRVGRGGRLFRIYKFRTMVASADKMGGSSTPEDDPRNKVYPGEFR